MDKQEGTRRADILGIIPARWNSSRFPGKPLALINGLPMVVRVYRQAIQALKHVVIATDDQRIAETAARYHADCLLTNSGHTTGTSRCSEAVINYRLAHGHDFESVINIQGDEPFISPKALKILADQILLPGIDIATLIRSENNPSELQNPDRVKVTIDNLGFALYFSRYPIPFIRQPLRTGFYPDFYIHTGVYAFKTSVLHHLQKLPAGNAETAESLEQLRWLESGYRIYCCKSDCESFGIDRPEDIEELKKSGLT